MKRAGLTTTPQAERDIDEHALFIAGDNLDAGLRFLDAIDHARDELAQHPEIGAERQFDSPALSGLRVWPVPRFERWLIFYIPSDTTVQIVRVLHGARDLPTILDQ